METFDCWEVGTPSYCPIQNSTIFVYTTPSLSVHLFMDTGYRHILAIINNSALNIVQCTTKDDVLCCHSVAKSLYWLWQPHELHWWACSLLLSYLGSPRCALKALNWDCQKKGELNLLNTSYLGFPGVVVVKNPPASAGDIKDSGLIPRL